MTLLYTSGTTGVPKGVLLSHHNVADAVAAANEKLARPEQIKTFHVMPSGWTPATGELTPTLKLRRRIIADKHAATIDAMYAG